MKKEKAAQLGLFCLGIVILLSLVLACLNSVQSTLAIPWHYSFEGEYSFDGETWYPYNDSTEIKATSGEVFIKGHYDMEVRGDYTVSYFNNHIAFLILVNGEVQYQSEFWERQVPPGMCGETWGSFSGVQAEKQDEVMFHIKHLHPHGQVTAFNDFMNYQYACNETLVGEMLEDEFTPVRVISVFVMAIAMILIGVSVAAFTMKMEFANEYALLGMVSLFSGLFLFLDTKDIYLVNDFIVLNTYGKQICMMMSSLGVMLLAVSSMKEHQSKKLSHLAVWATGFVDIVLLFLVVFEQIPMFETGYYWRISQYLFCILILGCGIYQLFRVKGLHQLLLASMILLGAQMVAMINEVFHWWTSILGVKILFILWFIILMLQIIIIVPKRYHLSIQAETLKKELANNRISMAMGQIRTHFIFNVLNAISGMCKYDPEKADETVLQFSRYLRNNIDIMQEDVCIPFEIALQHVEDYIALEQVRFPDKIRYKKEIIYKEFVIPPMLLQPIVENSIKHGLIPKPEGGEIELKSQRIGEDIVVTIRDNGVGAQSGNTKGCGIGLKNVRFRLEHMVKGNMTLEYPREGGAVVTIQMPVRVVKREK